MRGPRVPSRPYCEYPCLLGCLRGSQRRRKTQDTILLPCPRKLGRTERGTSFAFPLVTASAGTVVSHLRIPRAGLLHHDLPVEEASGAYLCSPLPTTPHPCYVLHDGSWSGLPGKQCGKPAGRGRKLRGGAALHGSVGPVSRTRPAEASLGASPGVDMAGT